MDNKIRATEEQLAYAKLLDIGMKAGLLILLVTFALYVSGIMTPHIPLEDVSKYWGMSVSKYLKAAAVPHGWGWTAMLDKGDFLNFIGVAFLAGVTILCYIRIVPILLKKKDVTYAVLAVVEVLVLALAASGVLKTGGH